MCDLWRWKHEPNHFPCCAMIRLFTLKKEKDEATAAALASGQGSAKKTSAAELRIQKGSLCASPLCWRHIWVSRSLFSEGSRMSFEVTIQNQHLHCVIAPFGVSPRGREQTLSLPWLCAVAHPAQTTTSSVCHKAASLSSTTLMICSTSASS